MDISSDKLQNLTQENLDMGKTFLIAAQNNSIRTSCIKVKIKNMHQNSRYRLCGDKDETIT